MKKRNPWLPLTVMETLGLSELPTELFATHLYIDSPLFDSVLTHIPELLSPTSVPFRNNWYEVTSGLASPTEQVSSKMPFWHALLALAFVLSRTFSGLSIRKKNYIKFTKFNQSLMWHDSSEKKQNIGQKTPLTCILLWEFLPKQYNIRICKIKKKRKQ